jgi:hypothetical protein
MAPCMLDHRPVFMRGIPSKAKLSSEEQKETVIDILGSICIHLLFKLSITNSSSPMLKIQCDSTPVINQIRNMIISIFRFVLPLASQIIISSLLIYKLFEIRRSVAPNQLMDKEYRFARIILWLNLMFIITELPLLITTFYFSLKK